MDVPDENMAAISEVLEIAKITQEYAGISDVDEFIEKLKLSDVDEFIEKLKFSTN
jgi:hypothetical protein